MGNLNFDELDDLFSGGGAPAFKFEKIGDAVTGTITDIEVRQQRDFDSGEAKVWSDGKPMMELVLTLKTDLRDDSIEDDDGERRVFCRGVMLTELRRAVRQAKVKKPEIGASVIILHSGLGEAKKRGFNAPKLYTVDYTPAAAKAVEDMFDDQADTDSNDGDASLSAAEMMAKLRKKEQAAS
jgi:hypothetical protein